jgi:hypothetical protein
VNHFVGLSLYRLRGESQEQKHKDKEQEQDQDGERCTVQSQVRAEEHIGKSPLVMHWILLPARWLELP